MSRWTIVRRAAAVGASVLLAMVLPLSPASAQDHKLQVTPEADTNVVGENHELTATIDSGSVATTAVNIDFEIESGPGDPDPENTAVSRTTPDMTCTVQIGQSTCKVVYTSSGAGTDTIRAWVDADGLNSTDESDPEEGRVADNTRDCGHTLPDPSDPDCLDVPNPGTTPEEDGTDVVEKTWEGPDSVAITPETDSAQVGQCNPFTIEAKRGNDAVGGVFVDVEQVHAVASGPTVSFCVPSGVPNPSSVDISKGDLAPPDEQPDQPGTLGGRTAVATNSFGLVSIGVSVTPSASSDGSGNVTITAFLDENGNEDPELTEPTDRATKTWTPAPPAQKARSINCEPETDTEDISSSHQVSCRVTDVEGNAVQGVEVRFNSTGVGTQAPTTTTSNQSGIASTTADSDEAGQQNVTGTLVDKTECQKQGGDPPGSFAGVCSDDITITWVDESPGEASKIDLRPKESTHKPGTEVQLVGTVTDANGNPIPGANVAWTDLGVGNITAAEPISDNNGRVHATIESRDPGNQQIFVALSGCGESQGGCRASVTHHWGPKRCDIFLSNFDDTYNGNGRGEVICAFGGNDKVSGGGGKDVIIGGGGNDRLSGGRGNDILKGGQGNDRLNGGPGRDRCRPGAGRDRLKSC